MMKKVIFIFVIWRLLLWLPLFSAPHLLAFRKGYEYTLLPYFTKTFNPINNPLLFPWGNFDGIYYLLIALKGYTVNAGFFPLFPLLIRLATLPFGTLLPFDPLEYLMAHLLVTAFAFGAMVVLYKLARLDYPVKVSLATVVFLLIFPTAFFLAGIYPEGLFLFLCVCSFYFARKRHWLLAGISAGLASATRPVGIVLAPALIWEFIVSEKPKPGNYGEIIRRGWALILAPAGLVAYMYYNFINWGNAFYFVAAQGNFRNNRSVTSLILFPQTLFRYFKILLTVSSAHYEWWTALSELAAFTFAALLIVAALKKRLRTSYLIFTLLGFFIPTSTGTFTGLPRYILVLFPIFIALALSGGKLFKLAYAVCAVILLALFLIFFSRGWYIA